MKTKKKIKKISHTEKTSLCTTIDRTDFKESGAKPLLTTNRPGDEIILFFAFEIENEK